MFAHAFLLFAALFAARIFPQEAAPLPHAQTPVLVELFTSEGCSSCPPADALLAQLDGEIAPTGQRMIVLSEHVTYWDRLGWVDPFAQEVFTSRQGAYSDNFDADEVYTPQVVVNGAEAVLGSDRDAVLLAVKAHGGSLPLAVDIVSYKPNGPNLSVMFTVSGSLPAGGADMYAVLADDRDTVHVRRGENAGRTLSHVSVARIVGKGTVLRPGEQTLVSIPIPPSLRQQPMDGRRLVLIAQQHGQGRVLGVASQEISVEFPAGVGKVVAQGRTLETR